MITEIENLIQEIEKEMKNTLEPVDLNFNKKWLRVRLLTLYDSAQKQEQERISRLLS